MAIIVKTELKIKFFYRHTLEMGGLGTSFLFVDESGIGLTKETVEVLAIDIIEVSTLDDSFWIGFIEEILSFLDNIATAVSASLEWAMYGSFDFMDGELELALVCLPRVWMLFGVDFIDTDWESDIEMKLGISIFDYYSLFLR